MKVVRAAAFVTTLVVAAACDSPTMIIDEDASGSSAAGGGGVIGSTSGGGKAQLPAGFSLLQFAFAANAHADGSATGQFHQVYESAGGTVDFRGRVTCVSFDAANGRAWIGGVITQNRSTNPAVQGEIHQPGRDVWFRVVDNGEGESAVDRTTVFGFEGGLGVTTSEQYCALQLWSANDAGTWAVVSGNIQVRP